MNPLLPEQVDTLRELNDLWLTRYRFGLVGAAALSFFFPYRWRHTNDLDLVVAVSQDAMPAICPPWERVLEHRWVSPHGVNVDILPVGQSYLDPNVVEWPSGTRMNIVGMRLAISAGVVREIEPGLSITIAPPQIVVLLKMVAYLDRPFERARDLEDMAYVLEDYVAADDLRRFGDEVPRNVGFEDTPAYLLGRDLAPSLGQEERSVIALFLTKALDERDGSGTQSRMARLGPVSWQGEPTVLLARLAAFQRGIEENRA